MAKQSGLFKIAGRLDEYSFYHTKRGAFVRKKGGISKSRIDNDENFRRTRENNAEFTTAITATRTLRKGLELMLSGASDGSVHNRLMALLSRVKAMDATSDRGQRTVEQGINDPMAMILLQGFEFSEGVAFNDVVKKPYTVNTATGEISLGTLIPSQDVAAPESATHIRLSCGWARIDFGTGATELVQSAPLDLVLDSTATPVTLTPPAAPAQATGKQFFLLKAEFLQMFNGKVYPLNNRQHNVVTIAGIV